MGSQTPISTSFTLQDGREVVLETGKLATQAHGSCVVKMGDTMLFASVVSAHEPKAGQSFFPLSVDYQEKFAAAGRIPGNFFKREARLSDYEILTCRLVDRAIRPLFPDGYMNETQVVINLISGEEDTLPDALAALAASTALSVSNIPWAGPISEVRVAKIDGAFVLNPGRVALETAELEIIVAATIDNVMMVEGEADECSEQDLIEAIKFGHEAIKVQCQAQLDLAQKVGEKATVKRIFEIPEKDTDLVNYVKGEVKEGIYKVVKGSLSKFDRKDQFSEVYENFQAKALEDKGEEFVEEHGSDMKEIFDKMKKEIIRRVILDEEVRLDGRKLDEVRPIWTEVNYLPSAHGSAIFNRGETQALASLTLGTKQDSQMIDTALKFGYEKFILHYNFPAYSVGEARPMRGPGRREVGHANLASRSIKKVMPAEYPYTVRIVSDIMESNGSSSMATVCAGSLALMDGGVPLSAPISGIAMGLVSDGEKTAVLSDILGDEDAVGDMDFKVTGTSNGICGCQMDIKIDGLPYEILEKALVQAKEGRIGILNRMNDTLNSSREELKPHAPRIEEVIIDKSFIGAVIGPGGKVIQEMQKETGTTINIEEVDEKGVISIFSNNKEGIEDALKRINQITYVPQVGDEYDAKVASLAPYGVFVEFMGKKGLLHISEISHSRIEKVEDVFKEGDSVKVKLIGIDVRSGKFKLSRKALMPRPPRDENRGRGGDNGSRPERSNEDRGRD